MTCISRIHPDSRASHAPAFEIAVKSGSTHRRGGRETVVLLHSSASSGRQWDALVRRLQTDFHVHAIDLHGHGRRPAWEDDRTLSVHDEAALALPLIERAEGAHVIGHSYGAVIAIHLAAARPRLVRSLTMFEPVLFNLLAEHEPQGAAALEVIAVAQAVYQHVGAGQLTAAAEHFVNYWSGAHAWDRLGAHHQAVIASRMPSVTRHFDAIDAASLSAAQLSRLRMPMLCLTGGKTTLAAQRIGALVQKLLPEALHETLGGLGHLGPITHAEVFNDRVLQFLALPRSPLAMTAS